MSEIDWNDRYSDEEFIYGTEPNAFLVEHSSELVVRWPTLDGRAIP